MTEPAHHTIPIPDDFPFIWDDPTDATLTWDQGAGHFPEAMPRLEADFWLQALGGISRANAYFGAPQHALIRFFNNYLYMSNKLVVEQTEEERAKEAAKARIATVIEAIDTRWHKDFLPTIQSHIDFWDTFDLKAASTFELLDHLDESWIRIGELWEIHFKIVPPAYDAMTRFTEYYKELFPDEEDAFAAHRLLQGLPNKTLDVGHSQWDLSQRAVAEPIVYRILTEQTPKDALTAFKTTAAGQDFLTELQRYLQEYGQRGNHWSLSLTSWQEDPTPVLRNVQDYLKNPANNPRSNHAALAATREQAIAATRKRLQGYPALARETFDAQLKQAQIGLIISEDHGFWIDFSATHKVRCVLLECGRRLSYADVITTTADIFLLHYDEVRTALAQLPAGNHRTLIKERRADLAHYRDLTPPKQLGVEPPPPEENKPKEDEKEQPPATEDTLRGQAGSPGTVRGPARIIDSLAQTDHLQPGDILVASTPSPSWTPLFGKVAGIVTEVGGILSHPAVVAREYQIPAVIGLDKAREFISEGQIIEVDGNVGLVRFVGV